MIKSAFLNVGKTSTSWFGWGLRQCTFICVGWQLTLCVIMALQEFISFI